MKRPVLMFDYDGVISDSLEVVLEEVVLACRELGYDKLASREALLKLSEGNVIANLVKSGFPVWKLRALARQFAPRIEAANARIQPFAGMPELLEQQADLHPTYVITSNATDVVERFLERHGIDNVLGVIGSDLEPSKVKKIRRVLKLHKGRHGHYFGDTKGDMVEARRAGATAIAVAWGWHPLDTLRRGKPHHIVHTQEELRAYLDSIMPAEGEEENHEETMVAGGAPVRRRRFHVGRVRDRLRRSR